MNWPIWVIIGFAVAGILVGWLQAKVKGIIGEKKVSVVLATLPDSDYIILYSGGQYGRYDDACRSHI